MEHYLNQLLQDISHATENVSWPFSEKEVDLWDWIPDDEEDRKAPVRALEEWTGIKKEMLVPAEMLNDEQVHRLLLTLIKMLDAYNWSFVVQIEVPERIQYETIRANFDQMAKVKRWHKGFFECCRRGTEHFKCEMKEYCHCAFFAELFKDFVDEDLSPEEERFRILEIEVEHIKKKYGSEWMKYYPYHLDPCFDDDDGKPFNYGLEEGDDDKEDEDKWWQN